MAPEPPETHGHRAPTGGEAAAGGTPFLRSNTGNALRLGARADELAKHAPLLLLHVLFDPDTIEFADGFFWSVVGHFCGREFKYCVIVLNYLFGVSKTLRK